MRGILSDAMSPSPSRHRSGRLRLVVVVVALGLALSACHGSKKHTATTGTTVVPSTDAKGQPNVSLALKLGKLDVQAGKTRKPFSHTLAAQLLTLVNHYVATAVTRPLLTGKHAGTLTDFQPSLAGRLKPGSHDRAALTDDNVPPFATVSKTVLQPLALVGLEDASGQLVMVGGQLGVYVKGTTAGGPLTVSRLGSLVFEKGKGGKWLISGYSLYVRRDTPTNSTTTSAASTSTTTKP